MMTPRMQKNMKTSDHHAKLGKPPWMADIMELTNAMIHASCIRGQPSASLSLGNRILTMPMEMVARAKGSPMMRPTLKDDRRCP
jgi:hypothetical protein